MTDRHIPSDLDVDLPELLRRARFGRDGYTAMRRQGRTPRAFRVGRKLWFSESEVQRWLLEERIQPDNVHAKHDAPVALPKATADSLDAGRRVALNQIQEGHEN